MSERRRSLFILLLVFGLIAASAVVVATKETKLGLDLQGGVQLVYEAQPTPQQPTIDQVALDRALQIMRERVDAFGVAEPELQLIGQQPDRGEPPRRRGRRARRRAGRLHRPAVLLRLGSQHPRRGVPDEPRPRSTAASSPSPACTPRSQRAAKCPAQEDANNAAAAAPRFYVFDKVSKQPIDGVQTFDSREAALDAGRRAARPRARSSRCPAGVLVDPRREGARRARTARSRRIPTAGG